MKLKKTVAIAAAAGALAAISVPAMAFENEFHGMYKLKWFNSNYENGGSAPLAIATTNLNFADPVSVFQRNTNSDSLRNANYFEQRARLQYIAKASDDLKLVTHFEIDSVFGDRAQGAATRGSGGALEADAVNLETKNVYLDFKIPSTPMRVTAGIQPYKDAFKGIFLDADIAGINTVTKLGNATVGLGYFRAYDQSYFGTRATRGVDNLDIAALSVDYAVSKNLKLGGAYYWYGDNRNYPNNDLTAVQRAAGLQNGELNIHVLGLNADAMIGKVNVSGFVATQVGKFNRYNTGTNNPNTIESTSLNAYAVNLAAKVPVGPGTFKTAGLYTTGNDGQAGHNGQTDAHNTAWQGVTTQLGGQFAAGTAAHSYNESGMMLLNRNAAAEGTSTDQNMVYTTGNNGQGLWLYTFGYDANITPKLYLNTNVGFAWAARTNYAQTATGLTTATTLRPANAADGGYNGTNFMGTEINMELGYKMYDNLTASLQAAYVILGGYYNNTLVVTDANGNRSARTPDDPYTIRTVLSYAF